MLGPACACGAQHSVPALHLERPQAFLQVVRQRLRSWQGQRRVVEPPQVCCCWRGLKAQAERFSAAVAAGLGPGQLCEAAHCATPPACCPAAGCWPGAAATLPACGLAARRVGCWPCCCCCLAMIARPEAGQKHLATLTPGAGTAELCRSPGTRCMAGVHVARAAWHCHANTAVLEAMTAHVRGRQAPYRFACAPSQRT